MTCLLLSTLLAFGWTQPIPDEDPCVVAMLVQPEPAGGVAVPVRYIAGIVAGEVSVVPEARLAVACTALRDWRIGRSLAARWYGWQEPRAADYAAVEMALNGACRCYPHFRFVGNDGDWERWTRLGWVEGDPPWVWRNGKWIVVATE